jgi:hypothetical protein
VSEVFFVLLVCADQITSRKVVSSACAFEISIFTRFISGKIFHDYCKSHSSFLGLFPCKSTTDAVPNTVYIQNPIDYRYIAPSLQEWLNYFPRYLRCTDSFSRASCQGVPPAFYGNRSLNMVFTAPRHPPPLRWSISIHSTPFQLTALRSILILYSINV